MKPTSPTPGFSQRWAAVQIPPTAFDRPPTAPLNLFHTCKCAPEGANVASVQIAPKSAHDQRLLFFTAYCAISRLSFNFEHKIAKLTTIESSKCKLSLQTTSPYRFIVPLSR